MLDSSLHTNNVGKSRKVNGNAPFSERALTFHGKCERICSVFQAGFMPIFDSKVGRLNRSEWVGMLRFRHMSEESIDDAVQSVIQQVGRIRKYCMPDYAEAIPEIWKTILTDMLGIRRKLLVKKGKKKGMVNWYQVASVLHYLYIKNVYITSYSESMLDVMLHGKGATYHNSVKSYELTLEQMDAIDRILAKNKKNHGL